MAGKRKGLGKGLGAYFGDDLMMAPTLGERAAVSRDTVRRARAAKAEEQKAEEQKEDSAEIRKKAAADAGEGSGKKNTEIAEEAAKQMNREKAVPKTKKAEKAEKAETKKPEAKKADKANTRKAETERTETIEAGNTKAEVKSAEAQYAETEGVVTASGEDEGNSAGEKAAKKASAETGNEDTTVSVLSLSLIEPNREQPRKIFAEDQLRELAESMKKYGVLQPLLVQKKQGYYEIVAGERRWRAAQMAGLGEVPVLVRDYTRQKSMEVALIENLQRQDLNPVEEAMAYQQLMEEFRLTQEEIAEKVSKSRAAITNTIRLLKLDARVLDMLIEGKISSGHARALLALEKGDMQVEAAKRIEAEGLSVRDVEKLVKKLTKPVKEKEKEPEEETRDDSFIYRDLENRMKSIMGTKVSINKKDKNKGRIEIEYYSAAELERLVELIESIQ